MALEIDGVIFDCDGTLVDSETAALDVLHEAIANLGISIPRPEMDVEFRGKSMRHSIETIVKKLGNSELNFVDEFERRLRTDMEARFAKGLESLPGAFELLSRLRIPYCIASNGPRHKMKVTLGLSGLWPLVSERLFSAYEVGVFKPDPGLFLYAASAMNVVPERCAVVEDSLPGIEAGLAAGMQVFALHPPDTTPAVISSQIVFIENLLAFDRILHDDA